MCHYGDATKYQSSRPSGFRQDFSDFSHINHYKTCVPGGGSFLAPEYNLNKLGRRLLDNATY